MAGPTASSRRLVPSQHVPVGPCSKLLNFIVLSYCVGITVVIQVFAKLAWRGGGGGGLVTGVENFSALTQIVIVSLDKNMWENIETKLLLSLINNNILSFSLN